TYIFGHADEAHLLGNLTFILLLGPIVEEKYGGASLSLMIVVTAIVTALVHIFLFPTTGLLGASGIVFMLIILVSFTNVHRGQIPVTFLLVAVLFIGKEIMESIEADNISQLAHIIGGICGGIFGFTIGKPRQIDTFA
ncbi:MAG: rhomboid family intramembrane serine protease, partial [Saprospiraceae bacterium]